MSLMECWMMVIHGTLVVLGHLAIPAAIYGAVYAVTAAVFLITLKVQSVDGVLRVGKDSLAYLIAHPCNRYDRKEEIRKYGSRADTGANQGSICAFYARMFNMLLFAWPFITLFIMGALVFGNAGRALLCGEYMTLDFSSEAFMKVHQMKWPLIVFVGPAVLLGLIIFTRHMLWHVLKGLTLGVVCSLPVAIPIAVGVVLVGLLVKNHDEEGTRSYAISEYVGSKKERFCKLVKFD